MSIDAGEQIKKSVQELLGERFVHNLSGLIYNSISTLWHIDKECEEHLSTITARAISTIFCLEYLSHIDALLKEKLKIKNLTDANLTDTKNLKNLKQRLSKEKELKGLARELLPQLKRLVDSIEAGSLETVTQIAHTGDYLLSSLEDMRSSKHPDYPMWLHATPYYYEKDLRYLLDRGSADFKKGPMKRSWKKQIRVEPFDIKEKTTNHRINLNAHHTTEEGFFPCMPKGKSKMRTSNV
jgi:hypothetical protein